MKKFEIEFYNLEEVIEEFEEMQRDGEDYSKEIAFLNSIKNGVKVRTFKKYHSILSKLYDYCGDWGINIYNAGTFIEIGL